jgi:transcriptional regulator with XRE-family HTH domain
MSTTKTPVQEALIRMRKRLKLTQQGLANAMKVTLPTVGKWESSRSPTGSSLAQLAAFALEAGDEETAQIFQQGIFGNTRNAIYLDAEKLDRQMMAWIFQKALVQLRANARNPRVKREYVRALRAIVRAYQVLAYEAAEILDIETVARIQTKLRKELNEQQEQKTKTKR